MVAMTFALPFVPVPESQALSCPAGRSREILFSFSWSLDLTVYIVKAGGLKLAVLLPQLPGCGDYRSAPPHPVCDMLLSAHSAGTGVSG
jgi:hypothetical protein